MDVGCFHRGMGGQCRSLLMPHEDDVLVFFTGGWGVSHEDDVLSAFQERGSSKTWMGAGYSIRQEVWRPLHV